MFKFKTALALFSVSFAFAACGEEKDDGGGTSTTGDSDNNSEISLGDGDGDKVDEVDSDPIDGCSDSYADQTGCSGENFEGENIPLDIYIMFDQSASMGCVIEAQKPWDFQGECCAESCGQVPRIDPLRQAVEQFLTDPQSAGISVGIGYFGQQEIGTTSCDAAAFSTPAVGIAELPGNAQAVLDSLYAVNPTGETPTGAAIRGACNAVGQWHEQQPGHKKVILLVTDGVPEAPSSGSCDPTVPDAAAAAASCLDDSPFVETYVLGVGQALDNLNQIAEAGGTEQAYLVNANVQTSVLAALNAIRADAVIPCTLPIPSPRDGSVIDYEKVNIGICDASSSNLATYYVESEGDCDLGAWYYEDTDSGKIIQLCDATCDTVSAAGSKLFFSVGCETVVVPVK